MDKTDLVQCVEKACNCEEQAITELYKYTYPGCYLMILKMCNDQELTEEVMQEGYILAFKKLPQLKHKTHFYNWLKAIFINTLYRHLEVKAQESKHSFPVDSNAIYTAKKESSVDNINSIVDINERNNILFETIQQLPENQRVCIILFYYEGLSIEEIAQALNIPTGSVKSRLHYGKIKLKGMLEENKLFSSMAAFGSVPVNGQILNSVLAALADSSSAAAVTAAGGTAAAGAVGAKIALGLITGATVVGIGSMIAYPQLMQRDNLIDTNKASATYSTTTAASTTAAVTSTVQTSTTAAITTTTAAPKSISFDYREVEGGICLSKYTGSEIDVAIPSQIDGKSVVEIGDKAFFHCKGVRSVTLPSSIKSIGKNAFRECYNLTSITLGSGVRRIDAMAFVDCQSLKRVVIPKNVEHLGMYSFAYCDSLEEVIIKSGLRQIGYNAFYGCNNLKQVSIPASVEDIGNDAFMGCSDTLILRVESGSAAEQYALEHGINFIN